MSAHLQRIATAAVLATIPADRRPDPAATSALARVRALHHRDRGGLWDACAHCRTPWPCPTTTAIEETTDE